MTTTELTIVGLQKDLQANYYPRLKNFLGSEKQAKKFLSAVMYSVQTTPELLKCEKNSLMTAFMKCAELNLYPSSVSGEAYVLPYWSGKKQIKMAQFQLGYQGLVTLLYRAGVNRIYSAIIKKNDKFSYINGKIHHEVDIFKSSAERGEAIGAYATAIFKGEEISVAMNKEDILKFKEFSKSAKKDEKDGTRESVWNIEKDPELWMWRKTLIKQLSKLLSKNADVFDALNEDNKDSIISDKEIITGPTALAIPEPAPEQPNEEQEYKAKNGKKIEELEEEIEEVQEGEIITGDKNL